MVAPSGPLDPLDESIWSALRDKVHAKRRQGAVNLQAAIKASGADNNPELMETIIAKLSNEYVPATQPSNAPVGGLVGLAAVGIALGPKSGRYLKKMVPPVLACFSHKENLIRYYACESLYNIAKLAKGEMLLYFNDIFDAMSKLVADSEDSIRNAVDLLDRLMRDTVSESAATYVSQFADEGQLDAHNADPATSQTAFSLPRFIPLLTERINVLDPRTRNFLINWIHVLNQIPGLDLVSYLPAFLTGLFKYLADEHEDVQQNASNALSRFLEEIKRNSQVQRDLAEQERRYAEEVPAPNRYDGDPSDGGETAISKLHLVGASTDENLSSLDIPDYNSIDKEYLDHDDWVPGQNVNIDHIRILEILAEFLDPKVDEHIVITALVWIDAFFKISARAMAAFFPRLLSLILPALGHRSTLVQEHASRINTTLFEFIIALPEGPNPEADQSNDLSWVTTPEASSNKPHRPFTKDLSSSAPLPDSDLGIQSNFTADQSELYSEYYEIDYEAAISELTVQFLHENEGTRVSAIQWLIALHQKSPHKTQNITAATVPVLLKTLSDSSEYVVTRDLFLLSQISQDSEKLYSEFMNKLLQLFATDRRLLEVRGNLIIRQLCLTHPPERIYCALAECLAQNEDVEFVSIMVQNLNNNLMTAPELHLVRKQLRSLDTREGQNLFLILFPSWCHNPVSTFSLCLLTQAYEQAYHLLILFSEIEMTMSMLIQVDKLVQLLESSAFTYLRLQLLEPEKYPYLHKCLYGLLMLLPQSSAFCALKNRLQSTIGVGYGNHGLPSGKPVSTIGVAPSSTGRSTPGQMQSSVSGYDRPSRMKAREESAGIQWDKLWDKFKKTHEENRQRNLQLEGSTYLPFPILNASSGLGQHSHQSHLNRSREGGLEAARRSSRPGTTGPMSGSVSGSGAPPRLGVDGTNSVGGNLQMSSFGIRSGSNAMASSQSASNATRTAIPSPNLSLLSSGNAGSGMGRVGSGVAVSATGTLPPTAKSGPTAPSGHGDGKGTPTPEGGSGTAMANVGGGGAGKSPATTAVPPARSRPQGRTGSLK